MKTLGAYFTLLIGYMRVNWRSSLEYRTNFLFEVILSIVEVGMYLFYWKVFFAISGGFPGASYEQLVALVAFNHIIYAGADTLMGNQVWEASSSIVKGQLDIFLAQPKSAVFQLFFSGAQPLRAVQIVTGTLVYFFVIPVTPVSVALYLFGFLVGTAIFSSWVIIIHSLTFRFGASVIVYKLLSVILHFAKKPANIFSLAIRVILYTVIPAAYLGTMQAQQALVPDLSTMVLLGVLAVVSPVLAGAIFRTAMRRYESGNLVGVRM